MTEHPDVLLVGDGQSVHTRRLAEALVGQRLRVSLAAFEGDALEGVAIHRLGRLSPAADRRYAYAVPVLARLIRRLRPQVVHGHFVSSYGLATALALRLLRPTQRPPLVQSAWGSDLLVTAKESWTRGRAAKLALARASLITTDSVDLDDEAGRLAPNVRRIRFTWGPPGSLFERPVSESKQIVVARAFEQRTRVDMAVHAFLSAANSGAGELAGWQLVVVGDGAEADAVRGAARGDPRVHLLGHIDLGALREVLASSRMFVNVPSSDATAAVLLDSLALGLTPVVTDLPAYREWVDASIGEVVPSTFSIQELAAAMIRASRRQRDVGAIRARARPAIWESQVDELIGQYRGLQ